MEFIYFFSRNVRSLINFLKEKLLETLRSNLSIAIKMTQNFLSEKINTFFFAEKKLAFLSVFLFFVFFGISFSPVHAYTIENSHASMSGDFVLSPAKVEININPGETATRTISVTNRVDKTVHFGVQVEDFEGSNDPNKTVVLLGNKTGPYSLKNYIKPEVTDFTLKPGERITLPISISVPKNEEPGGLYGSVLVRNLPTSGASGAQTVSRLGALFFVRVNGKAKESGQLKVFRLSDNGQKFYTHGPFPFEFTFQNTGNVHLIPYGTITIYNTLGSPIKKIKVDPYFALPNSIRYRKITCDKGLLFGRYKAVLQLNRGYGSSGGTIDTKQVVFWVLPWKWIVSFLAGLFVLILIIYLLTSKLEIRFKKK